MNLRTALNPEAIFATLADLISINSVNPEYPGGPGEAAIADYVSEFFKTNSIPFEVQPVFKGRPNIIGKLEGRPGGRTLILEAHMDTASELGMVVDPFQPKRIGNRMYGRGSCDTKGGLAAMMHALKAIHDSERQLETSILLAAVVDEEHSFRGVVKLLEKDLRADGAIVAEPTDLETAVASKGVLRWRLRAHGRSAHSSRPHLGINAITKMGELLVALETKYKPFLERQEHPLLGFPTLNVGVIRGGVQVNQVPGWCVMEVDRRMVPGETREQVWREFGTLIGELRMQDPEVEIEMESPMLEDFPLETSVTERVVEVVTQVSHRVRGVNRFVGVPYGSDASKLARGGTPSLIVGPGSIDQAHAAEEYVDLNQVALAAEIYTRTMLEF